MRETTRRFGLDDFRLVAALLVVAIHTSPLLSWSVTGDFILTRVIGRVAVPFFLIVSGYFLGAKRPAGRGRSVGFACLKLLIIYGISIAAYLPLNIYTGYFSAPDLVGRAVRDVLINGTFYHLWYLPAAITGLLIAYPLCRRLPISAALAVAGVLYLIGLGGDSYYHVLEGIPALRTFYGAIFSVSEYTRNGVFFAPMMITLGYACRVSRPPSRRVSAAGLLLSLAGMTGEALLLRRAGAMRHDSMYLLLLPVMYFLMSLLLRGGGRRSKPARDIALYIYLTHPWMIVLLRGLAKFAGLERLLIDQSGVHFLAVFALSAAVSVALCLMIQAVRGRAAPYISETGRAWAEIDLAAIRRNAGALQASLPRGCALMGVIKANAYGHGDLAVARALSEAGVHRFAVATLAEAVRLRKGGVREELLILGYTDPKDAGLLRRYRLTQTAVDAAYAEELNRLGRKIRVHLTIDTGMHRLGADCGDIDVIARVYALPNLEVTGIFTHLSVSDELSEEAVSFTRLQIARFFEIVDALRRRGIDPGLTHVQATYGVLNYPGLNCALARPGIGLYGVLSRRGETVTDAGLSPALSLRARIATVRRVRAGECVGYGRGARAARDMTVATVAIGYADGVPRGAAGSGAYVLVRGRRAPMVGSVCMDQLMADVTDIPDASAGDVITMIGTDGAETITCEDFAAWHGTITNDVLSGLGPRLSRIYVEGAAPRGIPGPGVPSRQGAPGRAL